MDANELRKAAKCVYLVTDEDVAFDLNKKLLWGARQAEILTEALTALRVWVNHEEGITSFLDNNEKREYDKAVGMAKLMILQGGK